MKAKTYRAEEYKVLFHLSFWDGALSGVLQNKADESFLYFDCVMDEPFECDNLDEGEKDFHHYRIFALFQMTPEQRHIIEEKHKSFQKQCGFNTDWDHRWKSYIPYDRPKEMIPAPNHSKITYDTDVANKEYPQFENSQIVGYTNDKELYKSATLNGQR
jgi:hypothetical protein